MTDGTGQKVVAKAGDLMYFPKGSKIIFDTPDTALGYFCGQRKTWDLHVKDANPEQPALEKLNPKMEHIPQITKKELPKSIHAAGLKPWTSHTLKPCTSYLPA